jgi:acyl-CoA synthetase (AMP-forming)/AMP-acid ligase II
MTILDFIKQADPANAAIAAPERESLTYEGLAALVGKTLQSLNGAGLGRADKVAIVLPNGPLMATAFVAVSAACIAAPLNPAFREDELRFYMEDLNIKALIVERGSASPAIAAAASLGIPLIDLAPRELAGDFSLHALARGQATHGGFVGADETALVLHTSGTTSKPKIVPLSQGNLTASANNIAKTLRLLKVDRCLNIMPLFHIHGLVAAVLATLASGGSVFCPPGFNALRFFGWLEEAKPTWYTAVPTMHQAILSRAERNVLVIKANPLRLIRSSSASLPVSVFNQLEAAFGCPVIEAYAMTENAHQMTSNQLPPDKRKAGFVGCAAGPKVAIMSPVGKILKAGKTGEVVTRGPNVTKGYENNPDANETAFAHGWFHTGDQGFMDEDGYIKITGRLKEIINRGGEKISPAEIDEALLDHAAVQQALAFAIPHDKLGEDVAAVVVLKEGAVATERELRDFVNDKLAAFKVPNKIYFLSEIPKGATGKLQRIGLAEKLGLA